jgi:membrane peptidoglycan carboxypeptidase
MKFLKALTFSLLAISAFGLALMWSITQELPSSHELRARALAVTYATEVFDCKGKHVGFVGGSRTVRPSSYVRFDDMPDDFIADLRVLEGDSPFGFSLPDIARAIITGTGGGSTISQQVYADIVERRDGKTYWHKIVEIVGSIRLSRAFTEQEIYELYLNRVQWWRGPRKGIAYASRRAFDKRPEELTRAEWLLLITVLPGPSSRARTLEGPNPGDLTPEYERRVHQLHKVGRMSASERDSLLKPIHMPHLRKDWHPGEGVRNPISSTIGLAERHILREAEQLIGPMATPALEVHTSICSDVQHAAHNHLEGLSPGESTFLMLNRNMEVVAYYATSRSKGGSPRTRGDSDLLTSPAFVPASRFKPLVYAPFIEKLLNEGHAAEAIENYQMPTSFEVGPGFEVEDRREGPITLREALVYSANAPAYAAIDALGVEAFAKDVAPSFGLIGLQSLPSLAVGAAEGPAGSSAVSETELTAAYVSLFLQNRRSARNVSFVKEIRERRRGDVIYSRPDSLNSADAETSEPLFSDETVRVLRSMMHASIFEGTSRELTVFDDDNMLWRANNLAVKTGTSEAQSNYRYLGASGVLQDYAFSLTRQGEGFNSGSYASNTALVPLRRILNEFCRDAEYAC